MPARVTMPALLDTAFVHLREGKLVAWQDAPTAKATSVAALAAIPTNFYANLAQVAKPLSGSNVYATGSIAFDLDGSGK